MTTIKVAADAPPDGAEIPPFCVRVHFMKKKLNIEVTLHKISEKFISLNPTDTHFQMDTLLYSKKFYLKFKYPQKIKIDTDNVVAEYRHGTLYVTCSIIQILNKETNKLFALRSSLTSKSGTEKSNTKKRQRPEIKPEPSSSSESEEAQHEQNGSMSEDESVEESMPVEKLSKNKEKPSSSAPGKSKNQQVSKDFILKILDETASKEEKTRSSKLEREAAKEKFIQQKAAQKATQKAARQSAKEQSLKQIMHDISSTKKSTTSVTEKKSSVKFQDDMAAPTPKRIKR